MSGTELCDDLVNFNLFDGVSTMNLFDREAERIGGDHQRSKQDIYKLSKITQPACNLGLPTVARLNVLRSKIQIPGGSKQFNV